MHSSTDCNISSIQFDFLINIGAPNILRRNWCSIVNEQLRFLLNFPTIKIYFDIHLFEYFEIYILINSAEIWSSRRDEEARSDVKIRVTLEKFVKIGNFIDGKHRVARHLEGESLMALLKAAAHHSDMVLNTYATDSWMIALSSLSASIPRYISAGNLVTGHRFLHLLWPPPIHWSLGAEKTRTRIDREELSR